jgi:signal transduction histidine kinase
MPHKRIPRTPTGGKPAEELLAILAPRAAPALDRAARRRGYPAATPSRAVSARAAGALGMARRQGEQLGRLLDQLLAAAGLERGQAHLARRSLVDAAVLAEEAGRAARLAHPDHPMIIEVAGPLLVRVDPLAVSRILGNLLDNAAAYSPHGGLIRLSARRDGVDAVLAVEDNGPGIPPDQRERIFQRYARLDQPTAGPGGRLGLGLYIARRLAHTTRGALLATDLPGRRGARLELRLPLSPPPSPHPGAAPAGGHGHPPGSSTPLPALPPTAGSWPWCGVLAPARWTMTETCKTTFADWSTLDG